MKSDAWPVTISKMKTFALIVAVFYLITIEEASLSQTKSTMVLVDLSEPNLAITGAPYGTRTRENMTFSRFPPKVLEKEEAELSFNPDMARTVTGAALHFRSDASAIELVFEFGQGVHRGPAFAVYQDGRLTQVAAFVNSLARVELTVGILNPGASDAVKSLGSGGISPFSMRS